MGLGKKILGAVYGVIALIFAMTMIINGDNKLIYLALCALFIFLMCTVLYTKKSEKTWIDLHCKLEHVNGLPIAEGMMCDIYSKQGKYEFKSGNMNFELDKMKVMDVCIKSKTEIQNQFVSSVGGAVGGALLFGPLGAVIGGRAKNKKIKTNTKYLIITYMTDDEVKYVGFDILQQIIPASKLLTEFQMSNHGTSSIEL